jgi:hypothetical protein
LGADATDVDDCITTEIEYNLETKNEVIHHIQNAKNAYGNNAATTGTTQIERRNAAWVDADYLTTTYMHIELDATLNGTIHENFIHIKGQWGGFGIDAMFRLRMQTGTVVGIFSVGDAPPSFEVAGYVSAAGKPVLRMRINGGTLEDTTFPVHIQRGSSQNGVAEDCPPVSRIIFNTGSNI